MPTTITKTVKSSGGHYSSLTAWEAGEQADLVTLDQIRQAECYAFVDSGGETIIDGWTTDSTHYIRIYTPTAERHNGTPETGYRKDVSGLNIGIWIREPDVILEGIALVAGTNNSNAIYVTGFGQTMTTKILNCFLDWQNATRSEYPIQVESINGSVIIANCMALNCGAHFFNLTNASGATGTAYLYNCTAHAGALSGNQLFESMYTRAAMTAIAKNCIGSYTGTPTNYSVFSSGWSASSTNNVSTDGTSPGSNPITGTPTYVSSTNLHLSSTDTVAINAGADLSSDSVFPFNYDIDGDTRPQGSAWDVGADEVVVAATVSFPPWRHPMMPHLAL